MDCTYLFLSPGLTVCSFKLITGHEGIGEIVQIGQNVRGFGLGDRVVADVGITVRNIWASEAPLSSNHINLDMYSAILVSTVGVANLFSVKIFNPRGLQPTVPLQNTSLCAFPIIIVIITIILPPYWFLAFNLTCLVSHHKKCYKINNLTDEEATLLEPAACAIHGLDKLNPSVGVEALLLGAGPTGLILAQLLKLNGASRVVIAANKGMKMDIAKKLNCGDEYVELDRKDPQAQWDKLKKDNPYGFDVVVEATGVEKLANDAIHYVRRGMTVWL